MAFRWSLRVELKNGGNGFKLSSPGVCFWGFIRITVQFIYVLLIQVKVKEGVQYIFKKNLNFIHFITKFWIMHSIITLYLRPQHRGKYIVDRKIINQL